MEDNRTLSGWPLKGTGGIVLALSVIILMAGGGTAWWSWNQLANPDYSASTETERSASSTSENPSPDSVTGIPMTTSAVTVYLLDTVDTGLELVPVTLDVDVATDTAEEPSTILMATFDQLLQGDVNTSDAVAFSAIPPETELLNLTVEDNGVYVDLSGDFTQGGGSASMVGRLTQVVYTATSLDADQSVWLSVDGEPLEWLGGEGLEIAQPMTRSAVDADFPLL